MKNFIVLYWEPGSCGDFVQSLLLSDTQNYSGIVERFECTDQGRISPTINKVFRQLDHEQHSWYHRMWSEKDCMYLQQHVGQGTQFIIPTHSLDQVQELQ
jgi:hypothetical protein